MSQAESVPLSSTNLDPKGQAPPKVPQVPKEVKKPVQIAKGIPSEDFWGNFNWFMENASRDQKVQQARLIAGDLGAVLTFPNAREGLLRRENMELSERLGKVSKPVQVSVKPNPMKNTQEEQKLHAAQAAIRTKRLELGLAKDAKDDPRLATLVTELKAAKEAFDTKKSSLSKA